LEQVDHPRPTNGIEIPPTMEDGSTKDLKKAWFEAIHSCAPETNWRQIETQNMLAKNNANNRNKDAGLITIAGKLQGEWEEKGTGRTILDSAE